MASAHSFHGWSSSAPSRSGASSSTSSRRALAVKLPHTPDVVEVRPRRRRARAAASRCPAPSLCQRNPATTQSAVRSCFTFTIARSSARYGSSRRLATMPSRPAPSNWSNQRSATVEVRRGRADRCTGGRRRTRRRSRRLARSPQRDRSQVAVVEREQVEGQEVGRRLGRQPVHPRRRRVDALLQRVEVQARRTGHDQLAVDRRSARAGASCSADDQLGEVAGERPLVAAAQLDLVAVAEHEAAEAVPLRLVQPAVALGQGGGGLGQHRCDGGHDGQVAPRSLAHREPDGDRAVEVAPGPTTGAVPCSSVGSSGQRCVGGAAIGRRGHRGAAWRRRRPASAAPTTRPDDGGAATTVPATVAQDRSRSRRRGSVQGQARHRHRPPRRAGRASRRPPRP